MNKSTFNAVGGWQSFLFCAGMYIVALFFSIFVCSSIFYVFNGAKSTSRTAEKTVMTTTAKQQLVAVNR